MALDFNKALDVKAEDVKPVPTPPAGHYVWKVTKGSINADAEQWQSVRFNCQAVSVFEDANDVDPEDLAAYGKVTGIMSDKSFMFDKINGTETDLIRMQNDVKRFAEHCGVEDVEKKSLKQLISECQNKQFVGQLNLKPRKDNPEAMNANIGKTAPVS